MTKRITEAQLDALAAAISALTGDDYSIDALYGGFALCKETTGGGSLNIFGGYIPKRELYNRAYAFMLGLTAKP